MTRSTRSSISKGSYANKDKDKDNVVPTKTPTKSTLETIGDYENNGNSNSNSNSNNSSKKRASTWASTSASTSASASAKQIKQRKEENKTIILQMKIHHLIDLATYEIEVDAYRGIYDPKTYEKYNKNLNDHDDKADDETVGTAGTAVITDTETEIDANSNSNIENSNGYGNEEEKNDKLDNEYKFNSCYGKLYCRPITSPNPAHGNKKNRNASNDNDNHHNHEHESCSENLTSCPCLQSWIEKAIHESKLKASKKRKTSTSSNRKERKGNSSKNASANVSISANGRSRSRKNELPIQDDSLICEPSTTTTNNTTVDTTPIDTTTITDIATSNNGKKKKKIDSDETKDGALVMDCSDDLNSPKSHDTNIFAGDDDVNAAGAYIVGRGVIRDTDDEDEVDTDLKSALMDIDEPNKEQTAANTSIPDTCTMTTANGTSESAKSEPKEQKIELSEPEEEAIKYTVKRPLGRCQCDFNPLCLTSIGGVVDDYINCKIIKGGNGGNDDNNFTKKFNEQMKDFDIEWEKLMEKEKIQELSQKQQREQELKERQKKMKERQKNQQLEQQQQLQKQQIEKKSVREKKQQHQVRAQLQQRQHEEKEEEQHEERNYRENDQDFNSLLPEKRIDVVDCVESDSDDDVEIVPRPRRRSDEILREKLERAKQAALTKKKQAELQRSKIEKMSEHMYKMYNAEEFKRSRLSSEDEQSGDENNENKINIIDLDEGKSDELRQSMNIDCEKIRTYLEKDIMSNVGDNKKHHKTKKKLNYVDQELAGAIFTQVKEWHKSMIFESLLEKEKMLLKRNNKCHSNDIIEATETAATFKYCKPVGLRNLGATCYLNSQLQCLSMNPVFLQGLFKWRMDKITTPMLRVISELQNLLVKMTNGPQNVVCTSGFSSSLGLENDEMQDPNEFARLLFDRMHESFQQSDKNYLPSYSLLPTIASIEHGDSPGLGGLLPQIFQGRFENSTKCLKCNRTSQKNEDFMDLLLPIEDFDSAKSNGRGKKEKSKCATVQYCLDKWFETEKLEGDNQYWCDQCGKKSDAERSVTLSEMPLVFNIQLARYMFDYKTMSKHKLMNPVLLPRLLNVPEKCHVKSKRKARSSTPYVLCAVQNHRGTSALSGHYVAEVMDWTTGIWFEFDDETVTMLKDGPTCSYGVDANIEEADGSSDPYSLFYVQQSRLCDIVKEQLSFDSCNTKGIIQEASTQRMDTYRLQLESLQQKQRIADRMNCRQSGILKFMLDQDKFLPRSSDTGVWVDAKTLCRFTSCNDTMDDILSNANEPILKHKHLICKHNKGLHPRVARLGKVISNESFEAYLSLLKAEKKLILKEQGLDPEEMSNTLCDVVIKTNMNLRCKECEETYRAELSEKVDKFKLMNKLYQALDPAYDKYDERQHNDEELYAVSSSFVTSFRKFVSKLMKEAASTKENKLNELSVSEVGLDAFDMKTLLPWLSNGKVQKSNIDAIDPYVNSKISCHHKRSTVLNNRRSVKYVTKSTFSDIQILFPDAIELPIYSKNGEINSCVDCFNEKVFQSKLPGKLLSLVESSPCLFNSDDDDESKDRGNSCYFIHKDEMEHIEKIGRLIQKRCPTKVGKEISVGQELKRKLINQFFDREPRTDQLIWRKQNLICSHEATILSTNFVHRLVSKWKTAEHDDKSSNSIASPDIESMDVIQILSEGKYQLFVSFVQKLGQLLSIEDETCESYANQTTLCDKSHPQVLIQGEAMSIVPRPCEDDCCGDKIFDPEGNDKNQESLSQNITNEPEIISVNDEAIKKFIDPDFHYRVYDFDGNHSLEYITGELEKHQSMSNDVGDPSNVRRSGRKRNSRLKSITSPYVFKSSRSNNLAQLRLLIDQRCRDNSGDLIDQKLALFIFDKEENKGAALQLEDVPNERQMKDVLEIVRDDDFVEIILYTELPKKRTTRKDDDSKRQQSKDENSNLYNLLLEIATSQNDDCTGDTCGKRKRNEERGFQGTFLQSTLVATPPCVEQKMTEKYIDDEEAVIVTERSLVI